MDPRYRIKQLKKKYNAKQYKNMDKKNIDKQKLKYNNNCNRSNLISDYYDLEYSCFCYFCLIKL